MHIFAPALIENTAHKKRVSATCLSLEIFAKRTENDL